MSDQKITSTTEEITPIIREADLFHPADIAAHLENLPLEEQISFVRSLSLEEAADTLAEMDEHVRVDLLENLDSTLASNIVMQMSPDDAADMLDELDEDHRDSLLSSMETEDAEELRQLMAFDPETAGGLMNTEIVILPQHLNVDEAINQIRSGMKDKEIPYYGYVVDEKARLVGVLSMRDLLLSKPGTIIGDSVKEQSLISVTFDKGKEEVAHVLAHYNFLALPVVDYQRHLIGAITHDDVMDVLQDIASEDMLSMVGAGQHESIDTPWLQSVKMRLPWLIVNFFNSTISAYIVHLFEGSIAQMAMLAALMPMVANQAGNTGQQSLAIVIRQLAQERFDHKRMWGAVYRELKIGLLNGFILAVLAAIAVVVVTQNTALGLVMGAALVLDMLLGAMAGASIPLILRQMGRDPAQASSIFLTTITDGAGFFIFLSLATLFLL